MYMDQFFASDHVHDAQWRLSERFEADIELQHPSIARETQWRGTTKSLLTQFRVSRSS